MSKIIRHFRATWSQKLTMHRQSNIVSLWIFIIKKINYVGNIDEEINSHEDIYWKIDESNETKWLIQINYNLHRINSKRENDARFRKHIILRTKMSREKSAFISHYFFTIHIGIMSLKIIHFDCVHCYFCITLWCCFDVLDREDLS